MTSQSPEEVAAHMRGPVVRAQTWLEAMLRDGQFDTAWRLCDDEFRTVRAQAWLWNNRDHPDINDPGLDRLLASFVAGGADTADLWADFARMEVDSYQRAWAHWVLDEMGVASRPRLVAVDYEIVLFARCGNEPIVFSEPTEIESLPFLMHHVSEAGWLVANAGADNRLRPGWPPVIDPDA